MSRGTVNPLALLALAMTFAPPAGGQDHHPRLYQALVAAQGPELGSAVQAWVGARRRGNVEVVRSLEMVSDRLAKKNLTFPAVLLRHGEKTKVLHEYSESGLRSVLSITDERLRRDVVAELRWIEDLEARIVQDARSERADPVQLQESSNRYASLLLDVDAKMVAAMRAEGPSVLACPVTARTMDPTSAGGAQEKSDLEVMYVLEFWESDPSRWQTFDKLSSPTTQSLPAGYYVMWARGRDGDGRFQEGERKRVIVTEPKEVDLLVSSGMGGG